MLSIEFVEFLKGECAISMSDFFKHKDKVKGDCVGCYIIFNQNKHKFYVGQAKRVLFRINQHFTGQGCEELFIDYCHMDQFQVKIVPLTKSGMDDIDLLEKQLIVKYKAFTTGYNKNRGNSR